MKKARRGRRQLKLPLVPSKEPGTLCLDNAQIYDALFGESDALLLRMQTGKVRAGMSAAFAASPKQLGKAAPSAARKHR